ncbi:MAG: alpha/beta hydrolase [Halomonas sp.]|uniref:alpha/beta hydrolase n=1 Tax=Halomonas sp. TaxID=1486246 RepID=UPI003970BC5A
MLLRWMAGIALVYLLVVGLAWAFQARLLYLSHMGREHVGTPADRGLAWAAVTLKTEDGLALDAWWLPHDSPRASLLFLHGNAGNISHRLDSLRQFHRLGLSVLILDYRGYGRSEGQPSETGLAMDARAGWRWLREEADQPPGDVVLFGRSLGAAVAAELAVGLESEAREGQGPAAVILESPFRSVPALAQRLYPFLPARWLARFSHDTETHVENIAAPLLVIHSRDDEIIPFAEGDAVYQSARQSKRLLEIRGGHNTGFLESEPDYSAGIDAFLTNQANLPPP